MEDSVSIKCFRSSIYKVNKIYYNAHVFKMASIKFQNFECHKFLKINGSLNDLIKMLMSLKNWIFSNIPTYF